MNIGRPTNIVFQKSPISSDVSLFAFMMKGERVGGDNRRIFRREKKAEL